MPTISVVPSPALSPPDGIEACIILAVEKALLDAAKVADPPITVQLPGERDPSPETALEWMQFWPLTVIPIPMGIANWFARAVFQVSCVSLLAEAREDGKTLRPFEIASVARRALHKQSLPIRDYRPDGSYTRSFGILSLGEVESRYLNPRMGTIPGKVGGQMGPVTSVPDIHMVALTVRGVTDVFTQL